MESPFLKNNDSLIIKILGKNNDTSTNNPTSAPDYSLSQYMDKFAVYIAVPMGVLVIFIAIILFIMTYCLFSKQISQDTFNNFFFRAVIALFAIVLFLVCHMIIMGMIKYVFMRYLVSIIFLLLICVGSVRCLNYFCEKFNPS